MSNRAKYFLPNFCDEWKSLDSMRPITVTHSSVTLRKLLEDCIRSDEMEYTHGEELPKTKQIQLLREDWKILSINEINGYLNYGFVQEVIDGERI